MDSEKERKWGEEDDGEIGRDRDRDRERKWEGRTNRKTVREESDKDVEYIWKIRGRETRGVRKGRNRIE